MATATDPYLFLEDISISIVDSVSQFEKIVAPYLTPAEDLIKNNAPGLFTSYVQFTQTNADSWIAALKLPFMDPVRAVVIALIYLTVIIGGSFIMSFLPAIPKLLMTPVQVAHNTFLTLLSLFMFLEGAHQFFKLDMSIIGNPVNHTPRGAPLARLLWIFYISKIPEFVDTVIMVLRKNTRQISFLHVYHHVSVWLIWNLVVNIGPGGDSMQSACENSFIHVVMYFYYLLSTLGIPFPLPKPAITLMQLIQFHLMLAQATYLLIYPIPGYPYVLAQILASYMLTLIALFVNFAVKNYCGAKPAPKPAAPKPAAKPNASPANGQVKKTQ